MSAPWKPTVFAALLASRALATPPNTPVITEPAFDGEQVSASDVHMETAPMTDPDLGDTHFCSDFEIWSSPATEMVWKATCVTGAGKVHTHLGDGAFTNSYTGRTELQFSSAYELHIRHQDNNGEWSPYATRSFITGPPSVVYPMMLDDVGDSPPPEWVDETGAPIVLPDGIVPASLRLESATGSLLLQFAGSSVSNPPQLAQHVAVRATVDAGINGQDLILPASFVNFTTDDGKPATIYLPALNILSGTQSIFWVSENGSTYYGSAGQTDPDLTSLAQGAPVPWAVAQPGYKVEVFASGFQLPVSIAFVPNPGSATNDPYFYVTELYGGIKVVTRDGTLRDYTTNLLNFNPTGAFPGSGEMGLTGLAVDPVTGDLFASLLYYAGGLLYPKVQRFHSDDGGLSSPPTLVADASGFGRHGTYEGAPVLGQPGAGTGTATSVRFNGNNDSVQFTNMDFGNVFSIAAWIKPTDLANIKCVMANAPGGGTVNGFKLFANTYNTSDGELILETGDGVSPNNNAVTTPGAVSQTGVWYHVAATVNRAQGLAELYVNGIRKTADNTISTNFANANRWQLGLFSDHGFGFVGSMDDVQVYSRVLSSNEVFALFLNPGSASSNLMARYALDETNLLRTTVFDGYGYAQGASHQISNVSLGPDGKLYVHVGDGFIASTAQNIDDYRGKILRMNLDGSPATDNPYFNAADGTNSRDYIYTYGYRNPFGGAWRNQDGKHYVVENGPSVDRLSWTRPGTNYLWDDSDASMTNFAIYNWATAHAPVNIAFVQTNTQGGSGFPVAKRDHFFVTESGPTWAGGPQPLGKRIVEFAADTNGALAAGPDTLVEYNGSGKATACGLAAGPDGLYFTDLYKDLNYITPIDRGAHVLRIKFVGSAAFGASAVAGPAPLTVQFTNLSTVLGPIGWQWRFGDGRFSADENPAHTYLTEGIYDVELRVAGSNGVGALRQQSFIFAGPLKPALLVVGSTNLAPGDSAVSNRLAKLGLSPITIKQGPDAVTADANGKSLVVISSTVTSGDVNTKFRDVTVPVLVWEQALYDDFGMVSTDPSDRGTTNNQAALAIIAPTSSLAAGLSGTVTVVNAGSVFSWGKPNAAAQSIATLTNDASASVIFVYASNAAMPGLTAPAGRAGFFIEDATAASLADSGWALFDAAVNALLGRDVDTDGDGKADIYDTDDDGDGMSDYFEDLHGLNRLSAGDAGADPDGDGASNYEEAKADTDPNDAGSVLHWLDPVPMDGSHLGLRWPARSHVTYQVQAVGSLTNGAWLNVGSPIVPVTNQDITVTNAIGTNNVQLFRLELP